MRKTAVFLVMLFILCGCAKAMPLKADQSYIDGVFSAFTQLVNESNALQKNVDEKIGQSDKELLNRSLMLSARLEELKMKFSDSEKMQYASYVGELEKSILNLKEECEQLFQDISKNNSF